MSFKNRRNRSRSPINRFSQRDNKKWHSDYELPKVDWESVKLIQFRKNFYIEHAVVSARSDYEIDSFRKEKDMTISGRSVPKPIFNFNEMNFPQYILNTIKKSKWMKPTAIQCQGWPMAMSGRNVVGIAQTGSGKTATFLLPALVHISAQPPLTPNDGPICLVLVPTRELAQQVETVVEEFGVSGGFNMVCLYGGSDRQYQLSDLKRKRPEIVVATPGRLIDLLRAGEINLRRTTYLVLDEADRMLDMGFEPQIRAVLNQVRPDRQVLMWSATWPQEVRKLAEDFLNEYIQVNIGGLDLHANHNINQHVEIVDEYDKDHRLVDILKKYNGVRTLIFVSMKKKSDRMAGLLKMKGFKVAAMHGDKPQRERERVLEAFRKGDINILVATDVASRGLDIDNIMLVVNFDFPQQIEDYVHRIGRTARHEKRGTSHTFFTSNDKKQARKLVSVLEEANQSVCDDLYEMAGVPLSKRKKPRQDIRKPTTNGDAPKAYRPPPVPAINNIVYPNSNNSYNSESKLRYPSFDPHKSSSAMNCNYMQPPNQAAAARPSRFSPMKPPYGGVVQPSHSWDSFMYQNQMNHYPQQQQQQSIPPQMMNGYDDDYEEMGIIARRWL